MSLLQDLSKRMDASLQSFVEHDLKGLRTGRASASLLDPVRVEAYGNTVPINQVGTVGVPEPRLITVQVWDKGLVTAVEKAIREAGLGLNPMPDGQLLRVPIPDLTEERRKEMAKLASQYAEKARIAVRNIRRDGQDKLKKMEKDSEISQDEHRGMSEKIQKITDEHIAKIDEQLAAKEKEILK